MTSNDVQQVDQKPKARKCSDCSKLFGTLASLKQHVGRCHKPYQVIVGDTYVARAVPVVVDKEWFMKCTACDKMFTESRRFLINHIETLSCIYCKLINNSYFLWGTRTNA